MCRSQYSRTCAVVATPDTILLARLPFGGLRAVRRALPMTRDIDRLTAHTFDVLVVGGGIYGLTIASDAADRGLTVALIDKHDFGSGASFNHSRTIHGGLRYLQ